MSASWKRIRIGVGFFAVTCVVAVIGYMLAGWDLLDSVYMTVITVFSVGYGEVRPLDNPVIKMFTIGIVIAGCSSAIYVVGAVVQMVAEGEINRALGGRRMSKGIDHLDKHAIVCGFGRVGQMLARDLATAKYPFVIIDNNAGRVAEAHEAGFLAMIGNASEEPTLEAAGINRARVLATVLPDDTANVFITLTARELNPTVEIISRAESPSTERKLLRSSATRIVLPALIGATKIAHMIIRPAAEDLLIETSGKMHLNEELRELGLELSEIQIDPDSSLVGQAIGDIESKGVNGFVVVALKKPDARFQKKPGPEVMLEAGDIFVILGHTDSLPSLARKAKARTQMTYRGHKA